jgi:NAD+ kinase
MKVAIYGRPVKIEGFKSFFMNFIHLLEENSIGYSLHDTFANYLKTNYGFSYESCDSKFIQTADFKCLISLGGDGTALDTLEIVGSSGLPVMGINLGRLGFLSSIKMDEIEDAIVAIKEGGTSVETRSVIQIDSDLPEINSFPYALTDFVVQKRDTSAMITVKTSLDGSFLNNYWADGLIVATPTGSSGYSLSCGGPLIFPGSKALIITPIAAHNLTVRPIVVPDDNTIQIESSGRADTVLITLDSRSFIVPSNTQLTIKRANFDFNMLKISGVTYMDTLRNKLLWGADKRDKQ